MKPIMSHVHREDGFALVMVVLLTTVLAVLSVTLMALASNEQTRSGQNTRREAAYQAAEAGVEDYIAKMVDDRLYYLHQVHAAEATRQEPGGTNVAAGSAWNYGLNWTYPAASTPGERWRTATSTASRSPRPARSTRRCGSSPPAGGRGARPRRVSSRRRSAPPRSPTSTASSTATSPGAPARRRTGRSTPTATSIMTAPRRRTCTPRVRSPVATT